MVDSPIPTVIPTGIRRGHPDASGERMGLAQGITKSEVFGPALLICIVADILIVRWTWRKANAGLERPQGEQIAGTP